MKTLAILALVGIAATAFFAFSSGPSSTVEAEFRDFLNTYRVGYGTTEEYAYRLAVFEANLARIEELNALNPLATFGITAFADRTSEEMEMRMGLFLEGEVREGEYVPATHHKDVDWSSLWKHTRDQGTCRSGWAFSAATVTEARYAIRNGKSSVITEFSEQELLDCETRYSHGCDGGWMHWAFAFAHDYGFCTETDYPYEGFDRRQCHMFDCKEKTYVNSYRRIRFMDEEELLTALEDGPVSVAVDARDWWSYKSGVITNCGLSLNHGVTLVGYHHGTDDNERDVSYVKIRNSWGDKMGEDGYVKLNCSFHQLT